jgi:hypothetical protein
LPEVVTLVPYRPANDRQRWCWDQTLPALRRLGYDVVTGQPKGEDWSRAEAVNDAAASAGPWDVALIGDCDTIPDEGSIRRAVAWVLDSGGAVRPHDMRIMLNAKGTLAFVQRGPAAVSRIRHTDKPHPGGGLLVVTREAYDAVGGYDESFKGWGYEDSDFNLRLLRLGLWERLPGKAWHLWHGREDNAPRPESRQRYRAMMQEYRRDIERWSRYKDLAHPQAVL